MSLGLLWQCCLSTSDQLKLFTSENKAGYIKTQTGIALKNRNYSNIVTVGMPVHFKLFSFSSIILLIMYVHSFDTLLIPFYWICLEYETEALLWKLRYFETRDLPSFFPLVMPFYIISISKKSNSLINVIINSMLAVCYT